MELGTLMRKLRDSMGFTTRYIARKMEVSLSTYMDWEHNKTSPSLKSYIKLANAFEIGPIKMMQYLTSSVSEHEYLLEKISIAELKEIVIHLTNQNLILKKNKERLEADLSEVKRKVASKQI